MTNDPIIGDKTTTTTMACDRPFYYKLCWKAIFAGTVAAIGIHLLLMTLGLAAGLAIFSPVTDANPVSNFSIGAALVWSVCALVALLFGGLIAGRFSHSAHSGFIHGVLVWSLTLIIAVLLVSMGSGVVVAGALKVIGIGTKAVASGAGDVVKEGVKKASDQVSSFIDESTQSMGTNTTQAEIKGKREIGYAVTKLFAPGGEAGWADNRTAAIKALTQYGGMNEADATKMVDDWTTSYKNLKADLDNAKAAAEQKAREAADRAASHLSCVAIWLFFSLLIGLVATALGGSCGAKCAMKHGDLYVQYP